eukprot:TRINITY_DN27932_c0_g1_i4.p1 TRINITY_DN27932_c0_g1~~TRINITY_DN27932_c0_g1_i4.p1  ORF type:complete len:160 (-),score=35.62 TRINITY_DN27932_c0_g1_i4:107-586(-)
MGQGYCHGNGKRRRGVLLCSEPEEFYSTSERGGSVRLLIVALNYHYLQKGARLTGIRDGMAVQRIAEKAEVEDIVFMRDDLDPHDPLFPTQQHVQEQVEAFGERTSPDDYFIFFFAGHADSFDKKKFPGLGTAQRARWPRTSCYGATCAALRWLRGSSS